MNVQTHLADSRADCAHRLALRIVKARHDAAEALYMAHTAHEAPHGYWASEGERLIAEIADLTLILDLLNEGE